MIHFQHQSTSVFDKIKMILILGTIFLIPFFFLTSTQEFFTTNKFYLLGFVALALIATSTIQFLITKKVVWIKRPMDNIVILFLAAIGLSTLIISPNKIQALLNPNFGFVLMLSLTIFYFYASRLLVSGMNKMVIMALQASGIIVSVIALFLFFQPFQSATLPAALSFLKNAYFTPIGNPLDLMIFLGFVIAVSGANVVISRKNNKEEFGIAQIFQIVSLVLAVAALALTAIGLFKPFSSAAAQQPALLLPPFRISWYGAVEILKAPLNALFGVGVDNYSFLFNKAKDALYNTSASWQVASFSIASSTLLHVVSEAGLLGFIAFILLLLTNVKNEIALLRNRNDIGSATPFAVAFLVMVAVVILLPPSFMVFFLLFVTLAMLTLHRLHNDHVAEPSVMNVEKLLPVYGVMIVVAALFLAGSSYGLIQSYRAENYFKKSLDGYLANSAQGLYDNQRAAIIINPYIERFRINFSQTNLLIANNIASKAIDSTTGQAKEGAQLSEADRNTVSQAIQASISEAKAAVALNDQKSSNWENLANIYRNVLNVAEGADTWTITAYQRAILLDPQNAVYRLNLGGIYFSLKDYQNAENLFQQSTQLKPDWSNAHYNLAYAAYQKGDYQLAVTEMQNTLYLLDPKKDAADYKKVQSDLEEFKKKLPADQTKQPEAGATNPTQKVGIPTPPVATISPKLQIKDAAPPAQPEGGTAAEQVPTSTPIPSVEPTITP